MKVLYECQNTSVSSAIIHFLFACAVVALSVALMELCYDNTAKRRYYVALALILILVPVTFAFGYVVSNPFVGEGRVYAYIEEGTAFSEVASKYEIVDNYGDLYILQQKRG